MNDSLPESGLPRQLVSMPLRALTVQEPYATCIIRGTKRLENRTHPLEIPSSREGLWLAIHASKSARALQPSDPTCAIVRLQCWPDLPSPEDMRQNCGKILGLAKFTACLRAEDVSDNNVWKGWAKDERNKQRYCWVIEDVRALSVPIECKGNQRIWKVDERVASEIWKRFDLL